MSGKLRDAGMHKSGQIGKSLDTCKAWVNMDGSDGSIRGGLGNSLNISSTVHDTTGRWTINFRQKILPNYVAAGITNAGTGNSYAGAWGDMDTAAGAFYDMEPTYLKIAHYKGGYRNTNLITVIVFGR